MRYRLFISWLLIILSGLIIFALIGVYSVVNLIPQYEKKIELIVSKKLGAEVDFKIDKIVWKGFEPVINIRDVEKKFFTQMIIQLTFHHEMIFIFNFALITQCTKSILSRNFG